MRVHGVQGDRRLRVILAARLVIAVDKRPLLKWLNLTPEDAHRLLALRDRVPRSLNAQARATIGDMRDIAAWRLPS